MTRKTPTPVVVLAPPALPAVADCGAALAAEALADAARLGLVDVGFACEGGPESPVWRALRLIARCLLAELIGYDDDLGGRTSCVAHALGIPLSGKWAYAGDDVRAAEAAVAGWGPDQLLTLILRLAAYGPLRSQAAGTITDRLPDDLLAWGGLSRADWPALFDRAAGMLPPERLKPKRLADTVAEWTARLEAHDDRG